MTSPPREATTTHLDCVDLEVVTSAGFRSTRLSLSLAAGQVAALLGPIGSGKSLIFERLAGIRRPLVSALGTVRFPASESQGERRRPVMLIPQDPRLALLPTDKVLAALLLELEGRTAPEGGELSQREKVLLCEAILERLDLQFSRVSNLTVQALSTSERHRVLVARAALSRAPLIAYDGLAEGLPLHHRAKISSLFSELLSEGRSIIASAREELSLELPVASTHRLGAQTSFALPLLPKAGSSKSPETRPLLEVKRLRVTAGKTGFLGARPASVPVDGATFSVRRGESLAIVGPAGSGKSTLLETLAGLRRAASGQVLFEGHDVTTARGRRGRQLRERVQLVFQDAANALAPERTVRHLLSSRGSSQTSRDLGPEQWLARLGLRPDLIDVPADFLSAGEAQRVSLGRSLLLEPELVLFDAPRQSGIDADGGLLAALLAAEKNEGRTFILTTSDPDTARAHSERTAILFAGRVLEIGNTEDLFARPAHPLTVALLSGTPLPQQKPDHPVRACPFSEVCPRSRPLDCSKREPSLAPVSGLRGSLGRHQVACFYPEPEAEMIAPEPPLDSGPDGSARFAFAPPLPEDEGESEPKVRFPRDREP